MPVLVSISIACSYPAISSSHCGVHNRNSHSLIARYLFTCVFLCVEHLLLNFPDIKIQKCHWNDILLLTKIFNNLVYIMLAL